MRSRRPRLTTTRCSRKRAAAAARPSTRTRRLPVEWSGRYGARPRRDGIRHLVRHAAGTRSRPILSLLTDEYQTRLVQQALPRGQLERRAVAGRNTAGPKASCGAGTIAGTQAAPDHGDAVSSCRSLTVVVGQLRHQHPRRPRVQHGAAPCRGSAPTCRAGTARRSVSGMATCSITWTSNIQGWTSHGLLRVLEQAADDRDLHAEPRRHGYVSRA